MQVRLAFSIAIRADSDILLLDEVLAVGDAAFQKKCFDHFMFLKKHGKTVVLVTHDMAAIRQYCDSGIMIDKGRIVKSGSVEEIAQAYQRLFNEKIKNTKLTTTKDSDRWGSGKLISTSCKVRVMDEYIEIISRFKSNSNLPPAVFGFTVYNSRGTNIVEGNTLRTGTATPVLKKGDRVTVRWEIPNIFASDTYTVSVACCNLSITEFYDWRNETEKFVINKEGHTASTVDPRLKVRLNDE